MAGSTGGSTNPGARRRERAPQPRAAELRKAASWHPAASRCAMTKPAPVRAETDPHRLEQRAKQITKGKGTPEYANFVELVPAGPGRDPRLHPKTPEREQRMSTRKWAGRVSTWRRALHDYHPANAELPSGPHHISARWVAQLCPSVSAPPLCSGGGGPTCVPAPMQSTCRPRPSRCRSPLKTAGRPAGGRVGGAAPRGNPVGSRRVGRGPAAPARQEAGGGAGGERAPREALPLQVHFAASVSSLKFPPCCAARPPARRAAIGCRGRPAAAPAAGCGGRGWWPAEAGQRTDVQAAAEARDHRSPDGRGN